MLTKLGLPGSLMLLIAAILHASPPGAGARPASPPVTVASPTSSSQRAAPPVKSDLDVSMGSKYTTLRVRRGERFTVTATLQGLRTEPAVETSGRLLKIVDQGITAEGTSYSTFIAVRVGRTTVLAREVPLGDMPDLIMKGTVLVIP